MKESDIKKQITDYLDRRGIWWERMNSGGYRGRMRAHKAGTADILAAPIISKWDEFTARYRHSSPMYLWIETKQPKEKQRPEQKEFETRVKSMGMHYLVARSVEDVESYLRTL